MHENERRTDQEKTQREESAKKEDYRRNLREQMNMLADEGKFEDILDRIMTGHRERTDPQPNFRQLRRALDVACQRDMQGFSARFLRQLLAFNALLTMRLQHGVNTHFESLAETDLNPKGFAEDGTDAVLAHWRDMAMLSTELLRSIAATERLWSLTEKNRGSARATTDAAHRFGLNGQEGNGHHHNDNGKHHSSNGHA